MEGVGAKYLRAGEVKDPVWYYTNAYASVFFNEVWDGLAVGSFGVMAACILLCVDKLTTVIWILLLGMSIGTTRVLPKIQISYRMS